MKAPEWPVKSMPKGEARVGGPGGLPVEIWGSVAKFLSLRDCCKLASTCQQLWKLDVLRIVLVDLIAPGKRSPAQGDSNAHEQCGP